MRNRAAVILLQNNKIALIKRRKGSQIYYVIPGGGIEAGETPKEAAKREALEELGVKVKLKGMLFKEEYNGTHYFFSGEIEGGEFGTGTGEEFSHQDKNRGTYEPVWIDVGKLSEIDIRPKEIVSKISAGKM